LFTSHTARSFPAAIGPRAVVERVARASRAGATAATDRESARIRGARKTRVCAAVDGDGCHTRARRGATTRERRRAGERDDGRDRRDDASDGARGDADDGKRDAKDAIGTRDALFESTARRRGRERDARRARGGARGRETGRGESVV
jgi:hypothetical protein